MVVDSVVSVPLGCSLTTSVLLKSVCFVVYFSCKYYFIFTDLVNLCFVLIFYTQTTCEFSFSFSFSMTSKLLHKCFKFLKNW